MATDDYSPWTAGDTLTPLSVQFATTNGTAIDITGSTFALVLQSANGPTRKTGAGTWTIDNATAGQAHYTFASGDVNTVGQWLIQVTRTQSGETQHFDTRYWIIDPAL